MKAFGVTMGAVGVRETGMVDAKNRNREVQRLWSEYEAAMWAGLAAVKRRGTMAAAELDQLSGEHRKLLRTLQRLRELTAD